MSANDRPNGIAGLVGRAPVGCAVTVGIKDKNRGFPTEKDRFHIVMPQDVDGVRPPHPAFVAYNSAPPERRKSLRGQLVHATEAECFRFSYRAQVLPGKPSHPGKAPACSGDGVRAVRWDGSKMCDIACPGEKCEFRQKRDEKTKVPCGPNMTFMFRLVWPDDNKVFPSMLAKFSSNGWNSTKNFLGFFEMIRNAAKQVGLTDYNLAGFPFQIQLVERTGKGQRYPTTVITPAVDPISFFLSAAARQREIAEARSMPALTDRSLAEEHEDWRLNIPGTPE